MDVINTLTEYMRHGIEAKRRGQACFMDLQKAFDTLDQVTLLPKLEKYGFRGPVNDLLDSYLQDRSQLLCSTNLIFGKMNMGTCVPQGSILGQFLFVLHLHGAIRGSKIVMLQMTLLL